MDFYLQGGKGLMDRSGGEERAYYERRWYEFETKGEVYTPRTGHTVVNHDGALYLFGGTDRKRRQQDLHRFDLNTAMWTQLQPRGLVPSRRSGAVAVTHDGMLYLFGGYDGRDGNYFNDLFAYNFENNVWVELRPRASIDPETQARKLVKPPPRTDHTLVYYNNALYVFGGFDGNKRFNDVYEFNLNTYEWKKKGSSGKKEHIPSSRFGHSGVVYDDALWVFGGWDGKETLDCLWKFSFRTEEWEKVKREKLVKEWVDLSADEESSVIVIGKDGQPCSSSSTMLLENRDAMGNTKDHISPPSSSSRIARLVKRRDSSSTNIIGGSENGVGDSNVQHPQTRTRARSGRSLCRQKSPTVSSSSNKSAKVSIHQNVGSRTFTEESTKVYLRSNQLNDGALGLVRQAEDAIPFQNHNGNRSLKPGKQIVAKKPWPRNRYRHTAIVHGHKMIVFGGVDKKHHRFNDLQEFDFISREWKEIKAYGIAPSSRTFHRAVAVDDHFYLLGGYNGTDRLNDTHCIYLGNLSPLPLVEICARYIRQNVEKIRQVSSFEQVPPTLIDQFLWTEDQDGILRGGYVDNNRVICHRLTLPSTPRSAHHSSTSSNMAQTKEKQQFHGQIGNDDVEEGKEIEEEQELTKIGRPAHPTVCTSCNHPVEKHEAIHYSHLYVCQYHNNFETRSSYDSYDEDASIVIDGDEGSNQFRITLDGNGFSETCSVVSDSISGSDEESKGEELARSVLNKNPPLGSIDLNARLTVLHPSDDTPTSTQSSSRIPRLFRKLRVRARSSSMSSTTSNSPKHTKTPNGEFPEQQPPEDFRALRVGVRRKRT